MNRACAVSLRVLLRLLSSRERRLVACDEIPRTFPGSHQVLGQLQVGLNNNSLSGVLVYDESGNLQKEISKFNMFGVFLTINANNLQVNQSHRKGYLIGPGDQQLAPFGY